MTLAFILTMPNVGSWNGKWSQADKLFCVLKKFDGQKGAARAAKLIAGSSYYYRWSDGWGASIEVKAVDAADARKMRKHSSGFCGYNWMIESILTYGKIYADHEIPKIEPEPKIEASVHEPEDKLGLEGDSGPSQPTEACWL